MCDYHDLGEFCSPDVTIISDKAGALNYVLFDHVCLLVTQSLLVCNTQKHSRMRQNPG